MSEPLTSHEIEDVLSSIRRLVSTELRPTLKPPTNADAVDKLLLTPQLRIVGGDASAAHVANEAPAARPDILSLGDGAEGGVVAAPVPVGSLPGFMPDAAQIEVFFGEAAPLRRPSIPEEYAEDYDEGGFAETAPVLRMVSNPPAATVAPGDDVLPGEAPDGSGDGSDIHAMAAVPEVDWAQSAEGWADDQPAFAATGDQADIPPRAEAAAALRRVERAASVKVADEPLAKAWADRVEAEITAELNRPERVAKAAEAYEAEETWVDEDLLRDLVQRIIREELAGSLGERITRNVRKLVRLEVNRALTTRDFE